MAVAVDNMFHGNATANSGGSSMISVSGETMHLIIEPFFAASGWRIHTSNRSEN
jgi:hypothetical protein